MGNAFRSVSRVFGKALAAAGLTADQPRTPTPAAADETQEEQRKARRARPQLIATGGVAGQELQVGQVQDTDNIFGN